jgi:hypothetical protein
METVLIVLATLAVVAIVLTAFRSMVLAVTAAFSH